MKYINMSNATKFIQYFWLWICLALNSFIYIVIIAINKCDWRIAIAGILMFILSISSAINRISLERIRAEMDNKKDLPISTLIIQYPLHFALYIMGAYALYKLNLFISLVIFISVILVEICIAILIPFRYKIRNKIIKLLKKKK